MALQVIFHWFVSGHFDVVFPVGSGGGHFDVVFFACQSGHLVYFLLVRGAGIFMLYFPLVWAWAFLCCIFA